MGEMIERVARALCVHAAGGDEFPLGESASLYTDANWKRFEREARAAIAAMREPTEAMCDAGDSVPGGPGFCDEPGDPPSAYEIFTAMIDSALAEGAQ